MKQFELNQSEQQELQRQWGLISRGAVDMLPEQELRTKLARFLKESKPLRVKQGFDPTSPDIHLGHTVGIRKLKQFQDLGHQVVLIVGDYTAMIGDPSGQSVTRPQLSYDEIMANAKTYQEQFFRILDKSKTEVVFNGDWFKKMQFSEVMRLASTYTVARLLERDDFSKRMKAEAPISVHELLYPLMQGYDSVAIRADIEIGGTDQKFNLLAARTIQEAHGMEPQCILTLPLLVGTDGEKKMSKSLANYIGIYESPREIFGKTMSIPDNLICQYFELATDISEQKLESLQEQLSRPEVNPMAIKKQLGETLVDMYHPAGSGRAAGEEFKRVFSQKKLPDQVPELTREELKKLEIKPDSIYLVHLIARAKLSRSNSEARKLIEAGSVSIDDQKITDINHEFPLDKDMVLRVGRRRFLRLVAN